MTDEICVNFSYVKDFPLFTIKIILQVIYIVYDETIFYNTRYNINYSLHMYVIVSRGHFH